MTDMKLLDLESNPKNVELVSEEENDKVDDVCGIAYYGLKSLIMKDLVWFLMTCMGYLVMKQLYHKYKKSFSMTNS